MFHLNELSRPSCLHWPWWEWKIHTRGWLNTKVQLSNNSHPSAVEHCIVCIWVCCKYLLFHKTNLWCDTGQYSFRKTSWTTPKNLGKENCRKVVLLVRCYWWSSLTGRRAHPPSAEDRKRRLPAGGYINANRPSTILNSSSSVGKVSPSKTNSCIWIP